MSVLINNTSLQSCLYNGSVVNKILVNGTQVWPDVPIGSWNWGTESEISDAAWWAGLQNFISNSTAEERAAFVGKSKAVDLGTAYWGLRYFKVVCVDYDRDMVLQNSDPAYAQPCLTFALDQPFPEYMMYLGTGAGDYVTDIDANKPNYAWINSSARDICHGFYYHLPEYIQNAIQPLDKWTDHPTDWNASNPNLVTINYLNNRTRVITRDPVWVPSLDEVGLVNTVYGEWGGSGVNRVPKNVEGSSNCYPALPKNGGHWDNYGYRGLQTNASRIRKTIIGDNPNPQAISWYTRSLVRSSQAVNNGNVFSINPSGGYTTHPSGYYGYYIVPFFCVKGS